MNASGCHRHSLCHPSDAHAASALDKCRSRPDVAHIPTCEHQRIRPAYDIGKGMDFGGLSTARGADRLRLRPPFVPKAERCALI